MTSECLYVRVIEPLGFKQLSFCDDPSWTGGIVRLTLFRKFRDFLRVDAKGFRLTSFVVARSTIERFSLFRCKQQSATVGGRDLLPMNVTRCNLCLRLILMR